MSTRPPGRHSHLGPGPSPASLFGSPGPHAIDDGARAASPAAQCQGFVRSAPYVLQDTRRQLGAKRSQEKLCGDQLAAGGGELPFQSLACPIAGEGWRSELMQAQDCREHAQHEIPAISPGVFDAGGRAVRRSRPGPRRSRLTTRPSSGLRPPRSARSGPRSSQPELDSCTVWGHCACSYMRDVPNGATQQQPRSGSRGRALVKEEDCAPSPTSSGAWMEFGTAGSEVILRSGLTA